MFIFARLLLAHLVADFPLQTSRVYVAKTKSLRGQVIHAAIHAATFAFFLFPYLCRPATWLLICLLSLIHIPVDWIKVFITRRWRGFDNVFMFLLDQSLHILTLALVFITPLGNLTTCLTGKTNLYLRLYDNNNLVAFLIAYLAATWGGGFFISALEKPAGGKTEFSLAEKWHGIIERSLYLLLPLAGSIFWSLLALPILLLRPLIANRLKKAEVSPGNIGSLAYGVVSLVIGLGAGLFLRYYL